VSRFARISFAVCVGFLILIALVTLYALGAP
jgi:hypothetical protein